MTNNFDTWLNSPERAEILSRKKSITEHTDKLIEHLNNNLPTDSDIHYCFDWGKKFYRIAIYTNNKDNSYSRVMADDKVFCFIDQETGDVLAPKGWNRRAKGVRFNILDDASRTDLFNAKEVA